MIYKLGEREVKKVGKPAFIAPNASVIGSVTLNEDSSVWFNVVIRGDVEDITIGARSNIQDGSVLHADPGSPLIIGDDVTVGHKAMIHGCTIGDGSLIGINAVVLNGAKIGKGCLVGANALVTEGTIIPDGHMALGSPAKKIVPMDQASQDMLLLSASNYVENGKRFAKDLTPE